jgi:hypothetical protein
MTQLDTTIYTDWLRCGASYKELARRHNTTKTIIANPIRRGLAARQLGIMPAQPTHILTVVVTHEAYDLIEAGIKLHEYRAIKKSWSDKLVEQCTENKIVFRDYQIIRFFRAYARNRKSMDLVCKGIRIGQPNPEWTCGLPIPERCYIIELGDIISKNNY